MRGESSAKFIFGYLVGAVVGLAMAWPLFKWATTDSAAEAGRAYMAYRACIERSSCQMTPQDWIDYYDLKWRLEEKEIE